MNTKNVYFYYLLICPYFFSERLKQVLGTAQEIKLIHVASKLTAVVLNFVIKHVYDTVTVRLFGSKFRIEYV
jgi:thiosulfate reductase cytochrome b subunit